MNTDKITSYLGLLQGVLAAGGTYWATASQDGTLDLHNPIFYLGMGIAVLMAVKAYYTNKATIPPAK